MNTFSLASKSALVTGSSRGIGLAIAGAITAAGGTVVCHGFDEADADALPPGSTYVRKDLARPESPAELVAEALAAAPELSLLVCNAGSFFDVPFLETTLAVWERTLTLNTRSAYFIIQAFAQAMKEKGRAGAVVIVSSTNGFQSEEDSTVYDISKGALVMMTRTLAHALAPQGIRVNGIAPGLIRTPLTAPGIDGSPGKTAQYEKKILLGKIGEPADCAGPTVFLLSAAASYITGQILVVDGGLTTGQIGKL